MKGKTLTETLWAEEADLSTYSATASYMDFGLGGSGSGSGFGGGGYKGGSGFGSRGYTGGISSHAGLRPIFDVPSITESFSFKPDARGPLVDYAKILNRQSGIDSSFASAIKSSPSSFGSGYNCLLDKEWIKKTLESCNSTPSSFGAKSDFGKDHGLGLGYVYEKMNVDGVDFKFRLRADEDKRIGQHLNDEVMIQKETSTLRRSFEPVINLHHIFEWKKEK